MQLAHIGQQLEVWEWGRDAPSRGGAAGAGVWIGAGSGCGVGLVHLADLTAQREESSPAREQPGSCEPRPDAGEQHCTLLCLGTNPLSWHLAGSCSRRASAQQGADSNVAGIAWTLQL